MSNHEVIRQLSELIERHGMEPNYVYETDESDVVRMYEDTAEVYAVFFNDRYDGGCVVYGRYNGVWTFSSSSRPLIKHLIESINHLEEIIE